MSQLTITKTKDYLVLKLPLGIFRDTSRTRAPQVSAKVKRAVQESLKALSKGEVSAEFKDVKGAIKFLRSL